METVIKPEVKRTGYFKSGKFRKALPLMCMTLPFFALVLVFNYLPLWGWSIGFVDYSPGVSIFASKFVGFKYFLRLFDVGSEFLNAMRNTMVLSSLIIVASPVCVVLAIAITEVKNDTFGRVIQTITSFPNFISWIIVYSLFFAFLSVDDGILNVFLTKTGWITQPTDILANPKVSWGLMTFASYWKSAGWNAIIYIAAIKGIDQELYQAAYVDGAGRFRRIWHITIPGILPTYAVIMVLTVGQFLNMGFEQYWVFRNAMVNEMINVLDTYAYQLGILNFDFSFSTAVGIFKTVASIFLMIIANGVHKRITGRSVI